MMSVMPNHNAMLLKTLVMAGVTNALAPEGTNASTVVFANATITKSPAMVNAMAACNSREAQQVGTSMSTTKSASTASKSCIARTDR